MGLRIHHVCIQTNEYEASKTFYQNILGFLLVKETRGFHGREYNTWLQLGDFYIELQTGKERLATYQKEAEGIVHLAFEVDDLPKKVKELESMGVNQFKKKGENIIYYVEGRGLCKLVAPEGTIIELKEEGL